MEIYISPMSGYTDYSFRQILNKYSPDLMYTEMLNSNLLKIRNEKTLNELLKMSPNETTGVQVFGSDMSILYDNFSYLNDMGYTNLLLNMGCPQPKITKNSGGANLLDRYDDVANLLKRLKLNGINVSIKIRDSVNTMKFFELANELELSYLCIHPRTKEQRFEGRANKKLVKELAQKKRSFKLIANGDIHSLDDYKEYKDTNIDGVMLARGIISRPCLIQEIRENKSLEQNMKDFIELFELLKKEKGDYKACLFINKYLKSLNICDKNILCEKDYYKKLNMLKELLCLN